MSINAQPFNPAFKLIDTLQDGQVLVFDVSENAFVNTSATGTGIGNVIPVTGIINSGTGVQLGNITGSTLELKSLIGGSGIDIVDNGDSVVLSANIISTTQDGTNLGTGIPLFAGKNLNNDLQFKSLGTTGDITISDNGSTVVLGINGTIGAGTYLEIDNNLADLGNIAAARNNLGVSSTAELDGMYISLNASSYPILDNVHDIGAPGHRFNDIYAETFHGTAVLADNLTITGQPNDILAYNGLSWESRSGLALNGTLLSLGGVTVDLAGLQSNVTANSFATVAYVDAAIDNVVGLSPATLDTLQELAASIGDDADFITTVNNLVSVEEAARIIADNNLQAELDATQAGAGLDINGSYTANVSTNYISSATTLKRADELLDSALKDLSDEVALLSGTGGDIATEIYVDNAIANVYANIGPHFSGDYNDLTNLPTIPTDVNQLTDASNLLEHFSGDYNDLINTPTVPTDINQLTDTTGVIPQDVSDLTDTTNLLKSDVSELTDTTGVIPDELTDLGIADGTSGQVLTTDGSGGFSFTNLPTLPAGVTVVELMKINYATDGSISSITDTSSGIANTTIASAVGGTVEIEFTSYNYPPAGIIMYGYVDATNEYVMNPLTKDMTTRKLQGGTGGDSFGSLGTNVLTLTLNEANTGASRTFGSTTHAWVALTMLG